VLDWYKSDVWLGAEVITIFLPARHSAAQPAWFEPRTCLMPGALLDLCYMCVQVTSGTGVEICL
jgi:hypothetical protein